MINPYKKISDSQTVILSIDDDPDDSAFLKDVFFSIVPTVKFIQVQDCDLLPGLLDEIKPSFVFVDMRMPKKDGLDCIKLLKQMPNTTNVPIIMLSGTNRVIDVAAAYEAGAHLFLLKPVNFTEYKNMIQAIVIKDWSDPEKVKQRYFVDDRYVAFG